MLENISYTNPEQVQEINKLVGKPFSIWERLKQKGIGSERLKIYDASPEIQEKLHPTQLNYCNIEIRPKGIIIRFRHLLETYGFIIPYTDLHLENDNHFYVISNSSHSITIGHLRSHKINHTFFVQLAEKHQYFLENHS